MKRFIENTAVKTATKREVRVLGLYDEYYLYHLEMDANTGVVTVRQFAAGQLAFEAKALSWKSAMEKASKHANEYKS